MAYSRVHCKLNFFQHFAHAETSQRTHRKIITIINAQYIHGLIRVYVKHDQFTEQTMNKSHSSVH